MKIIVTSRAEIEDGIIVRSSYLLISIRDPGKRRVRYKKAGGLVAVLELAFHDAEPTKGLATPPNIKTMTSEHAERIADFLHQWRAKAATVVVHCEQGMSRSPGVAIAIAEHLGQDTAWITKTYQPNEHVRKLATDALLKFKATLSERNP